MQKVAATSDVEEIVRRLNQIITASKHHIHIKQVQHAKFNSLKSSLQGNKVLIQIDYSGNYSNQAQNQIQSAYFGQNCFPIFTACSYLAIDGVLVNGNITVTSEAIDHSRIARLSCWLHVLLVIKEKYQKFPDSFALRIWSDGCASQFRSRFAFSLLSQFAINHTIF